MRSGGLNVSYIGVVDGICSTEDVPYGVFPYLFAVRYPLRNGWTGCRIAQIPGIFVHRLIKFKKITIFVYCDLCDMSSTKVNYNNLNL